MRPAGSLACGQHGRHRVLRRAIFRGRADTRCTGPSVNTLGPLIRTAWLGSFASAGRGAMGCASPCRGCFSRFVMGAAATSERLGSSARRSAAEVRGGCCSPPDSLGSPALRIASIRMGGQSGNYSMTLQWCPYLTLTMLRFVCVPNVDVLDSHHAAFRMRSQC